MSSRWPSGVVRLCLISVLFLCALPAEALAPTAAAGRAPLSLTCYGEGVIREAVRDLATAYAAGAPNTAYHGHVEIRLFGGDDRIQLPLGFRPKINLHDTGWYKIKYLKASDSEIIGNAIVSFIDKPFFRVDLASGRIDVSGLSGTFAGECRKIDS